MSRIAKAIHNHIQLATLARDELEVQAALFKGETRDRWNELERRWAELGEHVQRAKVAAADSRPQIQAAADLLAESLKSSYAEFRTALGR